jgi:hypothetical protein
VRNPPHLAPTEERGPRCAACGSPVEEEGQVCNVSHYLHVWQWIVNLTNEEGLAILDGQEVSLLPVEQQPWYHL